MSAALFNLVDADTQRPPSRGTANRQFRWSFAAYPLFGNLPEWDCTNEDHRPVICFRVDRMRWRPAACSDKMRRSLGSFRQSVCNTRSSRSSNGNGSK